MLKKINEILNILIFSCIGVFTLHSGYVYLHYVKYPDLYEMQSAPWYSSILVYGIFTIVITMILVFVKYVISKRNN